MKELLHLHKTFEKVVYTGQKVSSREFENCIFKDCDFSNTAFLSSTFMDCEFIDCNLSVLELLGSSLKNVVFKNCKLLGIAFHTCDDFLFQVEFENCVLDFASFANKKMPKTKFMSSSLKEVSFEGTHLKQSVFEKCNLAGAIFNDTNLTECNFTSASNYQIDPEFNVLKKARFSLQGIPGLLEKYDIKIV
ncbi:pentapeptide repeat-containing protein [Flavobacterium sp. SM2513]|uniref:pentapeptide repeat-containing protein n=1 Tax=Flavobacterium sp. SM2513 TaxID=3424766 RepID=UPI003D7F9ABC